MVCTVSRGPDHRVAVGATWDGLLHPYVGGLRTLTDACCDPRPSRVSATVSGSTTIYVDRTGAEGVIRRSKRQSTNHVPYQIILGK
eukprot:3313532-Prymnesium_polylepis.2